MNGGIADKLGNWYEADYVLVQLLRMLLDFIATARWESFDHRDAGIDCRLREGSLRVATQCKRRSSGTWSILDLAHASRSGKSVLAYARQLIERKDDGGADLYRFVTDATAARLRHATDTARTSGTADAWVAGLKDRTLPHLLAGFELADNPANRIRAWTLCACIHVQTVDRDTLRSQKEDFARALVGDAHARSLCDALQEFAQSHLGQEIHADELRANLRNQGIDFLHTFDQRSTAASLEGLQARFTDSILASGSGLRLERLETVRVVEACTNAERGSCVLVHGPQGCGKSFILADVLTALHTPQPGMPAVPSLPLRAYEVSTSAPQGSGDLLSRFKALCGDRRGIVVVDQLDQLRNAGASAQSLMQSVATMLDRTRRLGLVALIGCRTVDAERDTQLRNILSRYVHTTSIPIGDLPEPLVTSTLSRRGIAVDDLSPSIRRLLARPIALRMFLDLVAKRATPLRTESLIQLMQRWSEQLRRPWDERADAVLDKLVEYVEREATLSCPKVVLNDPAVVEALLDSGVLVEEEGGQVRPFHQLLTDSRIAVAWVRTVDTEALIDRLGPRHAQTLAHARRLRLAVPLIADRPTGTNLLEGLFRNDLLRPILKRSLLMGLAELDEPSLPIVRMVGEWLAAPRTGRVVVDWVLRGRPEWVIGLRQQIHRCWLDRSIDRDALLGLLASVSDRAGDEVALHLSNWAKADPGVLAAAHAVFFRDPSADSDALFEKRLDYEVSAARAYPYVDWNRMAASCPRRALRLISARLRQSDWPALCAYPEEFDRLICSDDAALQAITQLGFTVWEELDDWWLGLRIGEPYEVRVRDEDGECSLAKVVRLLACSLAVSLVREEITWGELVSRMPSPVRFTDAWLLLETGAALSTVASVDCNREVLTATADAASAWFRADPQLAHLTLGDAWGSYDLQLPKGFLKGVSLHLSTHELGHLENFLVEYRDEWTTDDERSRRRRGRLSNTRHGLTAAALLPSLPAERFSSRGRRVLGEVSRKFPTIPDLSPSSGWVTSAVPDEVADSWSPTVWMQKLTEAPERSNSRAHRKEEGSFPVFERHALVAQLGELAHRNPQKYVSVAEAFDERTPAAARCAILSAVGRTRPPQQYTADDWEPADAASVVALVERQPYLQEPECGRTIAWTVSERADCEWPVGVVDRLKEIALSPIMPAGRFTGTDLSHYRLNEDASAALDALSRLSFRNTRFQTDLLDLAARLIAHEDPGRRASSAILAMACMPADKNRAVTMLLAAASNSDVAAERDIARRLFAVATGNEFTDTQKSDALGHLLALSSAGEERKEALGGQFLLALHLRSAIGEAVLYDLLSRSLSAKRAAARALPSMVKANQNDSRLKPILIRLADDDDEPTANAAIMLPAHGGEWLLADESFVASMLATRAAQRSIEPLLRACDRCNQLVPLYSQILRIAAAPSSVNDSPAGYSIAALLSRLAEEGESKCRPNISTAAMDAWDALLEDGRAEARSVLAERVEP